MKGTLKGKVLERTGDFMPPMPSGQMTPFKAQVLIFTPPISIQECSMAQGMGGLSGLVYTGTRCASTPVETNERGEFSVELEPGDYSVFVEYAGKPYVWGGSREGAGYVEIQAGEIVEQDMVINRGTD